jgi:hypothetical protein
MFRWGGPNGIAENDFPKYAELLELLSNRPRFELALEQASKEIWIAYNSLDLIDAPNRFTQAICKVGIKLGFAGNDLRVLTVAAQPLDFGALLGGKLLWKDSFALGHGEFAHSYQWLSAGLALNWGSDTARLYQCTKGRSSVMPGWAKDDDKTKLKLRPLRLWEYLVDCTQWKPTLSPDLETATEWVTRAVTSLCQQPPDPNSTYQWLEQLLTGEETALSWALGGLALSKEALKAARWNPEEEDRLMEGNKKLFALVAKVLVEQFPVWCALSSPIETGGSFRNANNVTTLAKSKSDWFICAYETRRYDKLAASQNAALLDNIFVLLRTKVQVLAHTNTKGQLERACVLTLKSDDWGDLKITFPQDGPDVMPAAFKEFQLKLIQFRGALTGSKTQENIRVAFWSFVTSGFVNGERISNTLKKNLPHRYGRVILSAMDALSRGRQRHYTSPGKAAQGWKPAGKGIYTLSPPGHTPTNKPQLMISFHDVLGSLTEFAPM